MFPFGQTFVRLRAPLVADPYSETSTLPDWDHPGETPIDGFGFDPGGSLVVDTVNRTQVISKPTLIWLGADVPDVVQSDRVRGPDGRVWQIIGNPSVPTNPFTGWQPGATWPLELVEG